MTGLNIRKSRCIMGLSLIVGVLAMVPSGHAEVGVDAGFEAALNDFVTWLKGAGLEVDDDIDQNGIPDLDQAALLDYVLATPSVSCHSEVKTAYLTNLAIAGNHATIIENSALYVLMSSRGPQDFAKLLAGAVTLGEPNTFHLIQDALLRIYPNFHPDADLIPNISMEIYPAMDTPYLAAWGDADGDGVPNIEEFRAAANRAAFLQAATSAGATSSGAAPLLHITSVSAFGQTTDAKMTGVVENLPGDGTGYLVTFLSKSGDTYYSRPTGSGFLQTISNGVPWQFDFSDTRDPYAVRIVCYVVPVTSTPVDCSGGYCDQVPVPPDALASATVIRSPLTDPASKGGGPAPVYHELTTKTVGRGAVYTSPANAEQFLSGTAVTLRARASLGWRFVRWEGDYPAGDQLKEEISFVMDGARQLTAYFESELAGATASSSGPVDVFLSYTWQAEAGDLSGPFTVENGHIVQTETTGYNEPSGRASFPFSIAEAGVFVVKAMVNAPNVYANALAVNMDAEADDLPMMQWDIPVTNGFQERTVSWRGSGTAGANEFSPRYFALSAGTHELILRGREGGTQVASVRIERVREGYDLWVDFKYHGTENGGYYTPFNTLAEALAQAGADDSIGITGGKSGEAPRIIVAARLETPAGPVRLGDLTAPNTAKAAMVRAAAPPATETASDVDMQAVLDGILANVARGGGGGITAGDLAGLAASDDIRDGATFEPVIPYSLGKDGVARMARVDGTLALRLRSDGAIDPETITVDVPAYEVSAYHVAWVFAGADNDTRDLWVLIRPSAYWYYDDTFEVRVKSGTVSPVYTFTTESKTAYQDRTTVKEPPLWQPLPGVDYVAEGLNADQEAAGDIELAMLDLAAVGEALSGGLGRPYAIGPETVFDVPQRVWLPIPRGVDARGVALYYHKAHGEDAGWYPAERVEGFLEKGSYLNLGLPDGDYLGFLVRHGGVVQLGVTTVNPAGIPITSGTTAVPRVTRTRPYGYMLMALWLVAAIMATVVHMHAYELSKFARRNWMQLGLILQNEDGPFYGKACWSGYYKDNQGVWQLDRRKNPDRRRMHVPTPRELDMRKTIRRAIDRRIQEWGEQVSTS